MRSHERSINCDKTADLQMEVLDITGEVEVTRRSRRRKAGQQMNEITDTTKRQKTATTAKTKHTPKPNSRHKQMGPQSGKPATKKSTKKKSISLLSLYCWLKSNLVKLRKLTELSFWPICLPELKVNFLAISFQKGFNCGNISNLATKVITKFSQFLSWKVFKIVWWMQQCLW